MSLYYLVLSTVSASQSPCLATYWQQSSPAWPIRRPTSSKTIAGDDDCHLAQSATRGSIVPAREMPMPRKRKSQELADKDGLAVSHDEATGHSPANAGTWARPCRN